MQLAQKLCTATILALISIGVPSPVQAAQLFDFKYFLSGFEPFSDTVKTISAKGTITATELDSTNNTYRIIGISGTRTVGELTENITSLLPLNSYLGNDNLLDIDEPFLTENGLSFLVSSNNVDKKSPVNVFYFSTIGYSEDNLNKISGNFTVTARPVPESSTIGSSLIAIGLIWCMKSRKKTRHQESCSDFWRC
ncbi:MAG: PEP-CTERM sorting domain-containing protein [Nostoc sp. NMS2]|uniref:PEP-CTERM sorting domain-containing protein n=1 Tax=Nostoc sp. NMS2 TaxID=2815389 RepID=UPI0025D8FD78|nr:PEP-CTERM sorting domain-containing protein [Nostoc sp. NMS2]MBN3994074.1 PEP-CTERM sorting domain-containing protein [Nostoc sp. NMS2]